MGKFSGITKIAVKTTMAYRFEMFMTIIIAPISLAVFYFLWKSIYSNTGAIIRGFTFQQLLSYYVLSWVVGISTWNFIAEEIRHKVRTGKIIKDILKPMSYMTFWMYYTFSNRLFASFIESIPVLLMGIIFFSLKITAFFPLFLVSLVFAFILNYMLSFIIGLSAFWLVQNNGLVRFNRILMSLISGSVLPLSFFPLWFQNVSYFMPFQYITYVPITIWLGKYTLGGAINMLLLQVVWIFILYAIFLLIWGKAMNKLTTVGV